jgi:adenosylhomocysteinase
MDMSFAGQALSVEYIVKSKGMLEPGVHLMPRDLDMHVARLKLRAMGVQIDTLTSEQKRYLESWEEGT